MERRALVVALALALPLMLYGVPYAYAVTTSSSYQVKTDASIPANSYGEVVATCNTGDYATGGGFVSLNPYHVIIYQSIPQGGPPPNSWDVQVINEFALSSNVDAYVVCQTPITVAGIGVPQFGSFYIAIALGAVVYFMLSRRYARRPGVSPEVGRQI
jgi:hypothetical protein